MCAQCQTTGDYVAADNSSGDEDDDGAEAKEKPVKKKNVAKFLGFSEPKFFVDAVKKIRKQQRKDRVLPVVSVFPALHRCEGFLTPPLARTSCWTHFGTSGKSTSSPFAAQAGNAPCLGSASSTS